MAHSVYLQTKLCSACGRYSIYVFHRHVCLSHGGTIRNSYVYVVISQTRGTRLRRTRGSIVDCLIARLHCGSVHLQALHRPLEFHPVSIQHRACIASQGEVVSKSVRQCLPTYFVQWILLAWIYWLQPLLI